MRFRHAREGRGQVKFLGNTFITRTATKLTTIHEHDRTTDEDPKDRRARFHLAIGSQLQTHEASLTRHHGAEDVDKVWGIWYKIFGEWLVDGPGIEEKGRKAQRGRGAATITWTVQRPKLSSLLSATITKCTKEASKFQEVKDFGQHSRLLQACYRQLQSLHDSSKRTKETYYGPTPDYLQYRPEKPYNEFSDTIKPQPFDAYKGSSFTKTMFYAKGEVNDMLNICGNAELKIKRTTRAVAKEAFADKKQGMRRMYDAGRKRP